MLNTEMMSNDAPREPVSATVVVSARSMMLFYAVDVVLVATAVVVVLLPVAETAYEASDAVAASSSP